MPVIFKKCFLFHYDPAINSDKVFNLFLIDNENGTYSAISEYGRSGTKLNVKPLVENCSLAVAQTRYSAKCSEKFNHPRTPYTQTLNCPNSPTFNKFGTATVAVQDQQTAKIIEFKKPETEKLVSVTAEKESGRQKADEKRSKKIGVLTMNQLDALEL
jgi:hypothetical protein